MIGAKFAPLTTMNKEDRDMDTMITTFNTPVTETANEILGKNRRKKKIWVTADILDFCDKRRNLRKKSLEPEGSEKYITLPNKDNLQQYQKHRMISLISHPSKVMLKIVLNTLKPQAEKSFAEEQAGFRAGRNTTERSST